MIFFKINKEKENNNLNKGNNYLILIFILICSQVNGILYNKDMDIQHYNINLKLILKEYKINLLLILCLIEHKKCLIHILLNHLC